MADAFFTLWLGHLFGDYVLQNGYIAKNKERKFRVLLLHVLLIGVSQFLFLFPAFNVRVLGVVGLIVVLHFFIDYTKMRLSKHTWVSTPWYYSIDQGFHILSLLAATLFISDQRFFLSGNISLVACAIVVDAYALDIFAHLGWGETNEGYRRSWTGYFFRGLSALVYYWSWLGSLAVLVAGWIVEDRFNVVKTKKETTISFILSFAFNAFLIGFVKKTIWG